MVEGNGTSLHTGLNAEASLAQRRLVVVYAAAPYRTAYTCFDGRFDRHGQSGLWVGDSYHSRLGTGIRPTFHRVKPGRITRS